MSWLRGAKPSEDSFARRRLPLVVGSVAAASRDDYDDCANERAETKCHNENKHDSPGSGCSGLTALKKGI